MQDCIPKIKEGFPQKKDVSSIKRMSDGNIKAPQNILSPNSWHTSTVAPNGLKEFSHVYDCTSALYLGSNSQVWMVKQKGSGTTRVAKFLIPNASTLEIKILNFLKGRGGTVKLEDCLFNTSTNQYVLIFPYINLFSPNQSQMTAKDLKLYMYELLKSLSFCHGHNIVHCDLKPDNTMYHNGSFCLIDFGHAAMCHGNKASLMACNRYMAPELQQASTSYDTAIDVWAAAVIMTEKIFNITFKDAKEIYLFVKSASQPYMWEKMRQSPACSQSAIELLAQMLRWNPCHRISAHDAMQHHYFDDCRIPQPVISTAYIDP